VLKDGCDGVTGDSTCEGLVGAAVSPQLQRHRLTPPTNASLGNLVDMSVLLALPRTVRDRKWASGNTRVSTTIIWNVPCAGHSPSAIRVGEGE
jgi:hypothetical protein